MTTCARVTGVVLAAGQGRRMGMPKALVDAGDGSTWLARTVREIAAAGCTDLLVVVGAEERRVRASYEGPPVSFVLAQDWASGMGASLRAGLEALAAGAGERADAALIMLVDLPDVGAPVVRRVLDHADGAGAAQDVLARATYDGRPGHPVLVGRGHWAAMAATLSGDEGGRRYLDAHDATAIECGDLAAGRDQDTPPGTSGPA
ncbi:MULTISPECIES: nucleotidyltransferase family protein [Mumia]|uniref:nucleotidyltransferase family protein n=1 Tax=Mumia TaxID=1546255 RepID=UPI001423FDF7|nr:nucleotidyltransferase family protein [Mumia sp. ZJ430]